MKRAQLPDSSSPLKISSISLCCARSKLKFYYANGGGFSSLLLLLLRSRYIILLLDLNVQLIKLQLLQF